MKVRCDEGVNVWFTADQHFGHGNIIKYCDRPFSSVYEMDDQLIDNWNSVVGDNDFIFCLGDVTLNDDLSLYRYLECLKGNIYLILGSHDFRWFCGFNPSLAISASGYWVKVLQPLITLTVCDNGVEYPIVLCHYAMRTWDKSHHGSWHLYGHSHGRLLSFGKSFDVGVDCNDYRPISFSEVKKKMRRLEYEDPETHTRTKG